MTLMHVPRVASLSAIVTFRGLALHRKKPVKNCLNARAKMTSDKFDDERLLARKTNENKMKNGETLIYNI